MSVPAVTVAFMLSKRVVQVTLTAITEEAGAGLTSFVGTPLWKVTWVKINGTKLDPGAHSHYTEAAARLHVKNLLDLVDPKLKIEDVYTENI